MELENLVTKVRSLHGPSIPKSASQLPLTLKGPAKAYFKLLVLYWELDHHQIENAVAIPAPTLLLIPYNGTNEGHAYGAYIQEHNTHHIYTNPHSVPFLLYSSLNQCS